LRLLGLESDVRELGEMNQLQMGHARALLSLTGVQQMATAQTIVSKQLSVRETEDLIRRLQNLQSVSHTKKEADSALHEIQEQISSSLKAKVLLQQSAAGRGKIVIKYKNANDLNRLLEYLKYPTTPG